MLATLPPQHCSLKGGSSTPAPFRFYSSLLCQRNPLCLLGDSKEVTFGEGPWLAFCALAPGWPRPREEGFEKISSEGWGGTGWTDGALQAPH